MSNTKEQIQLVERLLPLGPEERVGVLFERFHGKIRKVCGAQLKGKPFHWIEDAVQDTYLNCLKGIANLRELERAKGWILKIAKNTALELLRRETWLSQWQTSLDSHNSADINQIRDDKKTYLSDEGRQAVLCEFLLQRKEFVVILFNFYKQLDSPQRLVLECVLNGLRPKAIAEHLAMGPSSVSYHLKRIAQIAKELWDDPDGDGPSSGGVGGTRPRRATAGGSTMTRAGGRAMKTTACGKRAQEFYRLLMQLPAFRDLGLNDDIDDTPVENLSDIIIRMSTHATQHSDEQRAERSRESVGIGPREGQKPSDIVASRSVARLAEEADEVIKQVDWVGLDNEQPSDQAGIVLETCCKRIETFYKLIGSRCVFVCVADSGASSLERMLLRSIETVYDRTIEWLTPVEPCLPSFSAGSLIRDCAGRIHSRAAGSPRPERMPHYLLCTKSPDLSSEALGDSAPMPKRPGASLRSKEELVYFAGYGEQGRRCRRLALDSIFQQKCESPSCQLGYLASLREDGSGLLPAADVSRRPNKHKSKSLVGSPTAARSGCSAGSRWTRLGAFALPWEDLYCPGRGELPDRYRTGGGEEVRDGGRFLLDFFLREEFDHRERPQEYLASFHGDNSAWLPSGGSLRWWGILNSASGLVAQSNLALTHSTATPAWAGDFLDIVDEAFRVWVQVICPITTAGTFPLFSGLPVQWRVQSRAESSQDSWFLAWLDCCFEGSVVNAPLTRVRHYDAISTSLRRRRSERARQARRAWLVYRLEHSNLPREYLCWCERELRRSLIPVQYGGGSLSCDLALTIDRSASVASGGMVELWSRSDLRRNTASVFDQAIGDHLGGSGYGSFVGAISSSHPSSWSVGVTPLSFSWSTGNQEDGAIIAEIEEWFSVQKKAHYPAGGVHRNAMVEIFVPVNWWLERVGFESRWFEHGVLPRTVSRYLGEIWPSQADWTWRLNDGDWYPEHVSDPISNPHFVAVSVEMVAKDGKKTATGRNLLDVLQVVQELTEDDPMRVFKKVISSGKLQDEVKFGRLSGSAYQVPIEVSLAHGVTLWLIGTARSHGERPMILRLAKEEVDDAQKGEHWSPEAALTWRTSAGSWSSEYEFGPKPTRPAVNGWVSGNDGVQYLSDQVTYLGELERVLSSVDVYVVSAPETPIGILRFEPHATDLAVAWERLHREVVCNHFEPESASCMHEERQQEIWFWISQADLN